MNSLSRELTPNKGVEDDLRGCLTKRVREHAEVPSQVSATLAQDQQQ